MPEDPLPEDPVPEDPVPDDLVAEDPVADDLVPEDLVPEDLVTRDAPLPGGALTSSGPVVPLLPHLDHGRFLPGTVLAGRYRILGLLGKGGMGEVYRADDLQLGQSVALKFLPPALAQDEAALDRFRGEVRIARQVSHPNVCRVHDIGEVDGLHFLSMEYADGEDLGSLLRRIGRVPRDKAIEIARELCLGLAAAHAKGVLHRDLKPANIMIDGRGKVLMTDFGLAALAEQISGKDLTSGTPAYMAPEQLAGREVSVKSDVYGLGLVLHELFTGKRVFDAASIEDLLEQRKGALPLAFELVEDLDASVEDVISQCLQTIPRSRPSSALEVLARLPGGDPLAAARAAGTTPSPGMVAAAGGDQGLRPRTGLMLFVALLVGLAMVTYLADRTTLFGRLSPQEPAVLVSKAQEFLADVKYFDTERPPLDMAYGFATEEARRSGTFGETGAGPLESLAGVGPFDGVYFWYRQSPRLLIPNLIFPEPLRMEVSRGVVSMRDPPPVVPGMVSVRLDLRGHLVEFTAVPELATVPALNALGPGTSDASPAEEFGQRWREAFESSTGLRLEPLGEGSILRPAPVYGDRRLAWTASPGPPSEAGTTDAAGRRERNWRAEATFYGPRLVHFQVLDEAGTRAARGAPGASSGQILAHSLVIGLFVLLLLGSALLVPRHLRMGRADRSGAARLSLFTFIALMLFWLCYASHVVDPAEIRLFVAALAKAAYISLMYWLWYIALEPYVRRLWPETLIAWNRLLAGRFRDPLVGRDILIGSVCGVVVMLLFQLNVVAPAWFGLNAPLPLPTLLESLLGVRFAAGEIVHSFLLGIESGLMLLLSFLLLLVLLRKQWVASVCFVGFYTVLLSLVQGNPYVALIFMGLSMALVTVLLLRYGFLVVVILVVVQHLLEFPITANVSAWYADSGLFALGAVVGLAGFGLWVSLAGQPLFRDRLFNRL